MKSSIRKIEKRAQRQFFGYQRTVGWICHLSVCPAPLKDHNLFDSDDTSHNNERMAGEASEVLPCLLRRNTSNVTLQSYFMSKWSKCLLLRVDN